MAKPFTDYALVRDTFGRGYRVLGVASEARRILYGRWLDTDDVTNVAERNVVLRYADADQATRAIQRVTEMYAAWAPRVEEAARAERQVWADRDAAMLAAAQPTP